MGTRKEHTSLKTLSIWKLETKTKNSNTYTMNQMNGMNHTQNMNMNNSSMNMGNTTSMNHSNHTDHLNHMDHSDHSSQMDHSTMTHGTAFYFSDLRHSLLFKEWAPKNNSQFIGACFAVFFMTVFFFFLQFLQKYLHQKYQTHEKTFIKRLLTPAHWLHAIINLVLFAWGYFLMLLAMSYNGCIFISICAGSFFGYLLFGNSEENANKNCCQSLK